MAEAAINLGVFGLDWSDDGAGMTFIGLRIGGSRTRGLELGFNPGLGIEVNNKGIGCGVRADIGIRDGVSAGASAHAGFAIFRAEITGVVGWDQSAGTWGTAYADAFNALESPEVHQARVCELRRRLFAAWQQHLESVTRGLGDQVWRAGVQEVRPQTSANTAVGLEGACPDCGNPRAAARFCGATGRLHSAGLCANCGLLPESSPFCTVTGRAHA
mmetsp:Transcript_46596/g.107605  ORF Transcript_46596/g.107605 Transcript_46596/m.107605 type:complete len:216 (+) Transcript_46596:80-727(+)